MGRCGRVSVFQWLPALRERYGIDFVVANAENAAAGAGATPKVLTALLDGGVDAITLGNHTWRHKALAPALDGFDRVVRPANYAEGVPGQGATVVTSKAGVKVGLVNVVGRVFMDPAQCPFRVAAREVERLRAATPVVLVDIHAEATSEKVAMGWYLDGRCSAVVGTHTHIQTADERVLPDGTAYITDVGMTGPQDSCLGVERERIIARFLTGMPTEFRVADERPGLCGVVIDIDAGTGRARSIVRIDTAADERR